MPNGRTHDLITVIVAGIANGVYFKTTYSPQVVPALVFTGTFLFAGYACAGDLDLNSSETNRWGPLKFIWAPYRIIVPHRSWISHGLVLGGVIRVLYLATASTLLFWLGLWLYSRLGPHINASEATRAEWGSLIHWSHTHQSLAFAALSGFVLAGTIHSISDFIYTGVKRRLPRKKRRKN